MVRLYAILSAEHDFLTVDQAYQLCCCACLSHLPAATLMGSNG